MYILGYGQIKIKLGLGQNKLKLDNRSNQSNKKFIKLLSGKNKMKISQKFYLKIWIFYYNLFPSIKI